jgi:hypothetical protein
LSYDFATTEDDYFKLRVLRVNEGLSVSAFHTWIDQVADGYGLLTCVLHGVYDDEHTRDQEWFDAMHERHLEELLGVLTAQKQRLWITTLSEAVKYHRLAAATKCCVTCRSDASLDVMLDCEPGVAERCGVSLTVTVSNRGSLRCRAVEQGTQRLTFDETDAGVCFDAYVNGPAISLEFWPVRSGSSSEGIGTA